LWPALGAVTAAVVALAIVVVSSSGDSTPPPPVLGPGGAASVLTTGAPPQATRSPAKARPFTPAPAAASKADTLSLERQVAQVFMVTIAGTSSSAVDALGSLDWGGVVLTRANFSSDGQVQALAGAVAGHAHGVGSTAPLIAATQEGGSNSAFPDLPPESEPTVGASGQATVAEAQARLAGQRLKRLGVNMTLAPLADVDTPGGPLSGRLFSTDPGAVARFTSAAENGYRASGVISAVGHFPGTGAASADPDEMTATVGGSLAQLRARDLIPFTAIASSAPVIMMANAAYAAFDGVTPASLAPAAVRLLRHELGFQGVVMTDDLDATLQPTGETPGQVALAALNAGDDLLYISGPAAERTAAYQGVLAAARRSAAVRARVRDALLHDLTLKFSSRISR
jgi:beta-N-acetylhexosaminidase